MLHLMPLAHLKIISLKYTHQHLTLQRLSNVFFNIMCYSYKIFRIYIIKIFLKGLRKYLYYKVILYD